MSFFGSFFGSDQKKQLKQGYADSTKMLREGYEQGRGDMEGYHGKAMGYLDPYMQSGAKTNALLANYLGVNGADAQRQAMADFQNDPGYQAQFDAGLGALDRSAAARGGVYSGSQMKDLSAFGQQFQRQAFNDRINHLAGFGAQGQQAATNAAGLTSQTGNALGNMAFGFGQQNAANRINFANGMAQAANIGPQNALNALGSVAKMFSDRRLKRDIERIGEMPSGLPVYRYRYLWSDDQHIGVMAQEAAELFPDAVESHGGFLSVDYSAIG